MDNKAWFMIGGFVLGAISGGTVTYFITKKKFEERAQKEIDSVKEYFTVPKVELKKDDIAKEPIDEKKDVIAEQAVKRPSLTEYAKKLKDGGYVNYSDKNVNPEKDEKIESSMKPEVIDPNEYGDDETYDQVSLTLYSDGVLADEDDTILNINEVIGEGNLDRMGEYEDDALHVKNNVRKVYYEVLADERSYIDATGKSVDADYDLYRRLGKDEEDK